MVEDVVTIKDAAKALGLSGAALYLAIKEERIAWRRVLNRITIPKTEVERLRKNKVKRAKQSNSNGNHHR